MPHPVELREQVIAEFEQGYSKSALARRHGLKFDTVLRWIRDWQDPARVRAKQLARRERGLAQRGKGLVRDRERELIRGILEKEPTLSVAQVIERLVEAGGPRLGKTAVARAIDRLGLKRVRLPIIQVVPERSSKPPRYRVSREWAPRPIGERQRYPSDLSDEEWEILAPLVPPSKAGGRNEKWPRRLLLDGVLYVLRSGCSWRMLPHDFPPWKTVYTTFRLWKMDGTWERINDHLRRQLRRQGGRATDTSVWVIDSQSAKTTEKGGNADMMRERS